MHPSGGMEFKLTDETKGSRKLEAGEKWWLLTAFWVRPGCSFVVQQQNP